MRRPPRCSCLWPWKKQHLNEVEVRRFQVISQRPKRLKRWQSTALPPREVTVTHTLTHTLPTDHFQSRTGQDRTTRTRPPSHYAEPSSRARRTPGDLITSDTYTGPSGSPAAKLCTVETKRVLLGKKERNNVRTKMQSRKKKDMKWRKGAEEEEYRAVTKYQAQEKL